MISEKLKIHDNFQFEVKQSYSLSGKGRKDDTYFVQTFFFIPNNLNINRETYSKEDFYKDMRAFVRLRTPFFTLRDLSADHNAIDRIRHSLDELHRKPSRETASAYSYHVKLFCLIYKKALSIQIKTIVKSRSEEETVRLIEEFLSCSTAVLDAFREIKKSELHGLDVDERTTFLFADEYMSLRTETHTCRMMDILAKSAPDILGRFRERCVALIHRESSYRASCGYPSIPSHEGDNESFVFRQASLKKFLSNILYLETRVEKGDKYAEQIIYSLAAGIAMVFATMVAFIGQTWYGGISLPFFFALVVSYMFKDRLKDLLRSYLYQGLHRRLYDRKRTIYHSFHEKIGLCRESFNMIDERQVPKRIIALRGRDRLTDIDNSMVSENVILYRKYVRLYRKRSTDIMRRYATNDIIDIMRFNIQHFTRSMDNPEKRIFIPTEDGFRKAYGMRVYHINIITYFLVDGVEHIRRFRLVLNRNGIRRIEEVLNHTLSSGNG